MEKKVIREVIRILSNLYKKKNKNNFGKIEYKLHGVNTMKVL